MYQIDGMPTKALRRYKLPSWHCDKSRGFNMLSFISKASTSSLTHLFAMREKRNIKIVLVTGVPRKFTVFPRQFLAPLKLNIRLCFAEKSVRYRKSIHQFFFTKLCPVSIYLFKVNNRSARTRYEICLKLTIRYQNYVNWRRFGVFAVNFEHISHLSCVSMAKFEQVNASWVTYHTCY